MYFGWADKNKQHEEAYKNLDEFFENLYQNAENNLEGCKVTYRESQNRFASTVMEAIRDRKVLLIQAGVGTGKSLGYLIPIFYTINNVTTFDKVVISTSTIALQEQLLKDIEFTSELLGIKIKAWLSKGINNYACLQRVTDKIVASAKFGDTETLEVLTAIKREMLTKDVCDKTHFSGIDSELWNDIRVCGGCDKCNLKRKCSFIEAQAHIRNMPIIVTNHTQLANMIKGSEDDLMGSSLLVVDEAHKLEEQIRLANQKSLNFKDITTRLAAINYKLDCDENHDYSYEMRKFAPLSSLMKSQLIELAKALRSNARTVYRKQKNYERANIEEVDKLTVNLDNERIRTAVSELLKTAKSIENFLKPLSNSGTFEDNYYFFHRLESLFDDMLLGDRSKKVYWVKFISPEKIELVYTVKDLSPYFDKIFEQKKPVVFTSATLTTNGNYDRFAKSIGVSEEQLAIEYPIESPFDFENHSLFYYDKEAMSPTVKDHKAYIEDIAMRVKDLIEVTKGKALVLFTSKSDMRDVYNLVKKMGLKERLILQENNDVTKCCEKFSSDTDSCLFATGAFWEGIDIPGETLSNLIVVKLPFPVQDPVVDYKKSNMPKSESWKVDLDEMLVRMAQGTGRLIRGKDDVGVVCCLDSRTPNYLDYLKNSLPFKKYTDDSQELIDFSNKVILKKEETDKDKQLKIKPIG